MLVYEEMPVTACLIGAMPELATWRETHPDWTIAGWRCEDDRTAGTSDPDYGAAKLLPASAGGEATLPGPVPIVPMTR